MTIEAIRPAHFPYFRYAEFTFSLGRYDGENAWLSGQSGTTCDHAAGKMAVRGGLGEQSATVYEKIGAILASADLTFDDVVHVVENVTVSGLDSYAEADEVRRKVMGSHRPTLSTVVVDRLARHALIDVQVLARRGGGLAVPAGAPGSWRSATSDQAGSVVHLPTIVPVSERGDIIAEGDFRGQYRYCLERAGTLLEMAGLSLASVVRTVDFSTPATRDSYATAALPRRDLLGPVYPAAAGILMSRMLVPDVLVSLEVTASREPAEVVNPGWSRYDALTCSPAVMAGRGLFMSGFAALDQDTARALSPADLAAQAEHVYTVIGELLRHAGGSAEDLIETIEYLTPAGFTDYSAVARARQRLLSPPWPASACVGCAGLLWPELMLEVVPFAVLA